MGSDIARVSYDAGRRYGGVVMQQGRVFVEADWNEQREIDGEALRADVLDIVGPAGTPDNGYKILLPLSPKPAKNYDFGIGPGAMYVGGVRVELTDACTYFTQPDWLIPDAPQVSQPRLEYIVLHLSEQDVSAVEDHALKDRALGGPDTAQRRRIVQHIERYTTNAQKCGDALAELETAWQADGLSFDPATMRLSPTAKLQVGFAGAGSPDVCEPAAEGGYLDADNQLIRVKIVDGTHLLWGYDDASTLYRVSVDTTTTLTLASRPVDAYHNPSKDQAVEVLLSSAALDPGLGDYIAEANGFVTTLSADYDPNLQQVSLNDALVDPNFKTGANLPPVFLRMWSGIVPFTPGTAVELGTTGVQVTLQDGPYHAGQYWMFAVRPSTPQIVYPERYLSAPQPPDGPREWICPLAVISWTDANGVRLADCRNPFDNLVDLTKRKSNGCCTVVVEPADVTEENSLQAIIDKYQSHAEYATICLMPGHYKLWEPLRLGAKHSHLTIEACRGGVVLHAAPGAESKFFDGLIVLVEANQVTLHGLALELPKISFGQSGVKFAGLQGAKSQKKNEEAILKNLFLSIGIRPIHCAHLTVTDCVFEFPTAKSEDIFGAAIFAGGRAVGLNIRDNQFACAETPPDGDRPLQILVGYLHLPVISLKSKGNADGVLISSALDDASFTGNQFSGLTAAALIAADTGDLRIEDNRVLKSVSGFWLLSLSALGQLEAIGNSSGYDKMYAETPSSAQGALEILRMVSQEPLFQYGAPMGQSYPTPHGYQVDAAAAEAPIAKDVETPRDPLMGIKNIVQKLFSFHLPAKAAAPASPQSAAPAPSEVTTTSTAVGEAGAAQEAPPQFHQAPAQFNQTPAQFNQATAEHIGTHLRSALTVSGNHVSALLNAKTQTSLAFFVFDDARDTTSSLTMTANTVENNAMKSATVIIALVERVVVTGNLIFNEGNGDFARSLMLLPGGATDFPAVAVTGNVFRGNPYLPPRAYVPAPLDNWNVLNTQM